MSLFRKLSVEDLKDNETYSFPQFGTTDYRIHNLIVMISSTKPDRDKIKKIIKENHSFILDIDTFYTKYKEEAIRLFTNEFFLDCLLEVIGLISLSPSEIITVNKICYDYLYTNNDAVKEKLLAITYSVNYRWIISLSAHVDMMSARIIAIIRHSSFDLHQVMSRLIKYISKIDIEPQAIIDIYTVLFDRMTIPIVDSLKSTDKRIVKTGLVLLLSMTSNDMYNVLLDYVFSLNGNMSIDQNKPFDFHEIADERFKKVLLQVELDVNVSLK